MRAEHGQIGARYGAIVIGAGPAGCVAAHGLAEAGVETLLVEKAVFPRMKVCGGCVSPAAAEILRRRGLGEALAGAGRAGVLRAEWGGRVARVRVAGRPVVERSVFDAALVRLASAAGVRFADGCGAVVESGGVRLRGADGAERVIGARVVVVADGLGGSALRGDARFGWRIAPGGAIGLGVVVDGSVLGGDSGEVRMVCSGLGYAGVARLGDGRLVVAGAARDVEGGAARTLARLLEPDARDADVPELGRVRGVPRLTRRRLAVEADGRVLVIGDAAGYVEPFTGEGMAWGIAHADAVVGHARRVLDGSYEPGTWSASLRAMQRHQQRACRVVANVLRRPWVGASVVGVCGAVPAWGDALGAVFGGRERGWAT